MQTKVKSIQVFRKPVDKAFEGDRCGICISNFDAKQFERGVVCTPNHVKTCYGVIIDMETIKHYKHSIASGSKYHISIGHETLLGKIELFAEPQPSTQTSSSHPFDFNRDYIYVNEINKDVNQEKTTPKDVVVENETNPKPHHGKVYAFIDFNYETNNTNNAVLCVSNSLVIGSKLDADIHLNQCRIAFYGHVVHAFANKDFKDIANNVVTGAASSKTTSSSSSLGSLRVYKNKTKEGIVERKHDEQTVIGKALFKKETNMDLFVGLKVTLSTGGYIEGGFGQSGKFKVRIPGRGEFLIFLERILTMGNFCYCYKKSWVVTSDQGSAGIDG